MKGDFADTTLLFTFEVRCYILCRPRWTNDAGSMIRALKTFPKQKHDQMVICNFIYRKD